jgi:uncharacterized protein (DUF427 family)
VDVEHVWDFPRPPGLEPVGRPLSIIFAGQTIAATDAGYRVLETSHPPVYYMPSSAFTGCVLKSVSCSSLCEWKVVAGYWNIRVGDHVAAQAGRSYPEPTAPFTAIRDFLAVYAGMMKSCFVGDEAVTPQPGGFYGGWVTRDLIGPFKGGPGSAGW